VAEQDRRSRVEHLEGLIETPATGGRTMADELAEAAFSPVEMERAALWVEAARRAQGPLTPETYSEQHAADVAVAEGGRWLHCRLEHGPGLCDVSCVGEFRHRPAWQPLPGGPPGLNDQVTTGWPEWDSEFMDAQLAALERIDAPTLMDASEADGIVTRGTAEQQARARRIIAKAAAINRERGKRDGS
jgi:hypothetical protein